MVLKTFKLTKNYLVHLFYLILIVSTIENRVVEEPVSYTPAPTEENINNVYKGSTINIKDQQQSDYKNPFSNTISNLSQIPKKLEGFKRKEEEIDIDHLPSYMDEESTSNGGIKEEEKKNAITELVKRLSSRHTINPTNTNEINNIGTNADNDIEDQQQGNDENLFSNMMPGLNEESTTNGGLEPIEEEIDTDPLQSDVNKESTIDTEDQQQGDDENSLNNIMLGLSGESTTNEDFEPEEMKEAKNDQKTKDGITNSKKKKKKKKETDKSKIIPDCEDDNMLHSLEPINSKELVVSSLEDVNIIKIKEENPKSEAIRKEKKKRKNKYWLVLTF